MWLPGQQLNSLLVCLGWWFPCVAPRVAAELSPSVAEVAASSYGFLVSDKTSPPGVWLPSGGFLVGDRIPPLV